MNRKNNDSQPWLLITVMAFLLVIMSFGHLLHSGGGNNPAPAPSPQREGVIRWLVRTVAESWIDGLFRSEPPPTEAEAIARPLSEQQLYMTMPVSQPSELMRDEGDNCKHGEGW